MRVKMASYTAAQALDMILLSTADLDSGEESDIPEDPHFPLPTLDDSEDEFEEEMESEDESQAGEGERGDESEEGEGESERESDESNRDNGKNKNVHA